RQDEEQCQDRPIHLDLITSSDYRCEAERNRVPRRLRLLQTCPRHATPPLAKWKCRLGAICGRSPDTWLDHAVGLAAVAFIAESFEIGQVVPPALCKRKPVMNLKADAHPARSAPYA